MSVFSQGLEEEVATLVLTVTGMYMNIWVLGIWGQLQFNHVLSSHVNGFLLTGAIPKLKNHGRIYWQACTRQNLTLITCSNIYETVPKSLLWVPTFVAGFEYVPWLACQKSHWRVANQVEGKFKTHLSPLEAQKKDLDSAS